MTETLPLSLQAFPRPDKEKESLQYLINRVNVQRGSFRNITEQSLEEEIQQLESGEAQETHGEELESREAEDDPKLKREEVAKAREDILKQIGQAQYECNTALECVSLLLSKSAPAAAQITMSPSLRQRVPLGSLGAEIIQEPQVSEMDKHNENLVAMGWRMQSLNGAADNLLSSASRLKEEMGRETTYWDQIFKVKDSGWSLYRSPRERHTLGVRYGFAEAAPSFRDRGLAALRRNDDGSLRLDRAVKSSVDKRLRVRILQQGRPIASSSHATINASDDDSLEKEILDARNSLFDEELHYELDREARNLVNQGVRSTNGNVLLPYETDKQIEISLPSFDDEEPEENIGNDTTATAIAIALRILLSHSHRQNLQNRSKIPSPLREGKTSRPTYALIKPVLKFFQHQASVTSTQTFATNITKTLAKAGIEASFQTAKLSHDLTSLSSSISQQQKTSSAMDALVRTLTSPHQTLLTLTLTILPSTSPTPTPLITLDINISTTLAPPNTGTTFTLTTTNLTLDPSLPQQTQLTTTSTLETHILDLITLSLQQHLLQNSSSWRVLSPYAHSIARTVEGGKARDVLTLEMGKGGLGLSWERSGEVGERGRWSWSSGEHGEGFGEGESEERALVEVVGSLL